jgi:Phage major capsid protein E
MPALDIFSGSAFSMVALTDAINKMPYVPGRIGQLGLFREQGVSTTSVMIEEREGSLTLVETTSRGAPAVQHVANKRKARSLTVPHVALEDTILADEVQNVRAFGSENMLEGVQAVVNQRLSEMATKMDATLEHLRVGAIKGQILDADGTAVIYDLSPSSGSPRIPRSTSTSTTRARRRVRSRRSATTSGARSRTSWASCPMTTSTPCAGPTSSTT